MRFKFDKNKSKKLKTNPRRNLSFDEAKEI